MLKNPIFNYKPSVTKPQSITHNVSEYFIALCTLKQDTHTLIYFYLVSIFLICNPYLFVECMLPICIYWTFYLCPAPCNTLFLYPHIRRMNQIKYRPSKAASRSSRSAKRPPTRERQVSTILHAPHYSSDVPPFHRFFKLHGRPKSSVRNMESPS